MINPPSPNQNKGFQKMIEDIIVIVLALGIVIAILIALGPTIAHVFGQIMAAF